MHKYRLVAKKGEGTFSEVLKAQCIKNGKYVAIKCMKNHFDSLDQVNNLREIQALRRLSPHANIIKLLEVLYDQPTGRLALVFELMDMNIYELIRGRRHYVAEDRIKNYMYQLMKSMDHMHRNGIFHRDIKPENILIMDDCLKLADFGSCRGIYSKQPYTEYISTRWYRAPECLLTDGYYNYKMDMWGVGCVFFEIVSLFPLFPGTNELDQIQKIHNILGTPPADLLAKMKKRSAHMDFNFPPKEGTGVAKLIPHVNPECTDLVVKLLSYNPDERLSARQALRHPYFRDIREAEKRQKAMMQPDVAGAGHLAGLESEKVRQQQTVSSNGSDHEHPGSPNEASATAAAAAGAAAGAAPPAAPVAPMGQVVSMPSGATAAAGGGIGGVGASHDGLPTISKAHASEHRVDDEGGDSAHRLPGLAAQSSVASLENGAGGGTGALPAGLTDDPSASLPPIANLSLSKANMTSSTVAAGPAHAARRSTMSYYESGYKGKQGAGAAGAGAGAGAAGPGVAAAAGVAQVGGAGAGPAAVGGAGANASHTSRRQSVGAVPKFHANKGAAGPAGAVGAGHAATAAMAVAGGHPTRHDTQSAVKYKANMSKTNSKYISPYSLRQLAGAAGAADK